MSDSEKSGIIIHSGHAMFVLGLAVLAMSVGNKCASDHFNDKVRVLENKVERLERTCVVKGDLVKKGHGKKEAYP